MRVALFALAALIAGTAMIATAPAEAQESTRIIIRKLPPRSFLDPGPVVKPGTARDLNYIYAAQPFYPQYGGQGGITGSRWPLPSRFELPGY
ncbi:Uncharacterised protein [Starkeya nomas]|uniref:Uncharacterized protein n=2 Tax=Xanthobacteraceae TaxID=335928 RepID=A0A5S9PDT1_9HYPH|nr:MULTISPECIES: hypothetical protein [Xanthobacteraceae]TSJ60622.1 hypothetical protein FO470_17945 [Ancylobacter moscoviensis]CAA0101800.1 Uncharacterised protein [Starkeya nomas]